MISPTLLLTLILSLHFFQISDANSDCAPSSCGIIRNISSPFRLKGDPKQCGDRRFELVCDNNTTSLYLDSHQFYVKAINYSTDTPTIRVADASINTNDTCSFPNSSAHGIDFASQGYYFDLKNWPVNLMSCPHPLENSSLLTEITHSCATSNSSRYSYIKVGHMNASEVKRMCRIDVIVMTSWRGFQDSNNLSLDEINRSLLYGFELNACTWCGRRLLRFILLILGLSCFALIPTAMSFIGFAVGLGVSTYINTAITVIIAIIQRLIIWPFAMWFLVHKFRKRHLSMFDAIESFLQSDDNNLVPIRYSYKNIRKMTRNFKDKIGEGGYGQVYKGKLRSGHYVAVKLLGKSGANVQDFINEIATIGRIHHVNVVKLVGYCAQGSKRALVYDFMPNGSLEKYILKSEKANSLNWDQKFEIAVGVARGIEYLHRGCDVQILHFDIKPHNILLDDKFIPKLSDFGLAKFCSPEKTSVTMTFARGTIGYVAPELISRSIGAISYKADVYSFGMMLMEMAGLKRDLTENNDESSMCFPYWIYDYVNNGKDIGIGIAKENNDNYENDGTRILVRKMAIVALWCIQMSPHDRPSMNKVLEMLEGDIERLQVPSYPSQSTENVLNMNESGSLCSSDSLPLLSHVSSSVEIAIQK